MRDVLTTDALDYTYGLFRAVTPNCPLTPMPMPTPTPTGTVIDVIGDDLII